MTEEDKNKTFDAHNYTLELCEKLGIDEDLDPSGYEVIYLFILSILLKEH